MPVMVRVEKIKNLQNKACLPPFLCYLLCPGYFAKPPPLGSPVVLSAILFSEPFWLGGLGLVVPDPSES